MRIHVVFLRLRLFFLQLEPLLPKKAGTHGLETGI